MRMKSDVRFNEIITCFTDVTGCCLSTTVIIELVADTSVRHATVLIAAVVVWFVEAPLRVAAYSHHVTHASSTHFPERFPL